MLLSDISSTLPWMSFSHDIQCGLSGLISRLNHRCFLWEPLQLLSFSSVLRRFLASRCFSSVLRRFLASRCFSSVLRRFLASLCFPARGCYLSWTAGICSLLWRWKYTAKTASRSGQNCLSRWNFYFRLISRFGAKDTAPSLRRTAGCATGSFH